jgi:hypothetical protein
VRWQDYQAAVGRLYTELAHDGDLEINVRLRDVSTGDQRQVDAWWRPVLGNHTVNILIDAKYRKGKIDVKDVEEVASLGAAVGANKCILVAPNGWSAAAERKAALLSMDLRLLTLTDALGLIHTSPWIVCPQCASDGILITQGGSPIAYEAITPVWAAGICPECEAYHVLCADCGDRITASRGTVAECQCLYNWRADNGLIFFRITSEDPVWIGPES